MFSVFYKYEFVDEFVSAQPPASNTITDTTQTNAMNMTVVINGTVTANTTVNVTAA